MIDQAEYPFQILFIHGTEGINDAEAVRLDFIAPVKEFKELSIRITQNVHRLDSHSIALFFYFCADLHGFGSFGLEKALPNNIDGIARIYIKIIYRETAIVCKHRKQRFSLFIRDKTFRILSISENRFPAAEALRR